MMFWAFAIRLRGGDRPHIQHVIFRQTYMELVCFLRVMNISDRLERAEETSSDAVVKRLARLEEQVVVT